MRTKRMADIRRLGMVSFFLLAPGELDAWQPAPREQWIRCNQDDYLEWDRDEL